MLAGLIGGALQLGTSLFGMSQSKKAAEKAAAAAREAARQRVEGLNNAITERRAGTEEGLGYLAPYTVTGYQSNDLLSDALGVNGPERQSAYYANFQNDPGFDATLRAGTDAIEQSGASSGMLRSGGTLKSLFGYGQRLKQSMFSDRLNRLAGLGQQGQQAAMGSAGIATSGSSDVANYLKSIGEANAGGTIGVSNAETAGTQNMLQMLGYGIGGAKNSLNDLFGSFKMGSSPMSLSAGTAGGTGLFGFGGLY